MALPSSSLSFRVKRSEPEVIIPTKPTPQELKPVSDIDDLDGFRFQIPIIFFYNNTGKQDPIKVIREALAHSLIYYYPLVGRLKEGFNNKLTEDWNGQGVTRLACGGFVLALHVNHTMCDASGLVQFLNAIAKGAMAPSVQPVWQRHLFNARNPPQITRTHHEFDDSQLTHSNSFCPKVFLFWSQTHKGTSETTPTKPYLCRTLTLRLNPKETVLVSCLVSTCGKNHYPTLHIPLGYYGNTAVYPAAVSNAELLSQKPLEYAVELVKKAKDQIKEEEGRPMYKIEGNFIVSDTTKVGLGDVDLGWGLSICADPAMAFYPISFHVSYRDGIVVPICFQFWPWKGLNKSSTKCARKVVICMHRGFEQNVYRTLCVYLVCLENKRH
ncbi:hypothetical protein UlMin_002434 [Ulmus minor]